MMEAPERNSPDGAVSRGHLLPVVCSNRVSHRRPPSYWPYSLKPKIHFIRNVFITSVVRLARDCGGKGTEKCNLTDLPSSRTDTLNTIHAVVWHTHLYQSLCYWHFANVDVGTDTAVWETHCTTKVVTLVLRSVIKRAWRGALRLRMEKPVIFTPKWYSL